MRIAFVIHSMKSGGAERAISNLSLEMMGDHDISVILFDAVDIGYPVGGKIIDLKAPSYESKIGKMFNVLMRAYRLRKLYKKEKFDSIYTFMEGANFPSIIATKETFASVHDDPVHLPALYQPYIPWLYKRAKKIIACSLAGERKIQKMYGLNNTTTIFNSVDVDFLIEASQKPILEKTPFLLAVGRLAHQKGFDLLLKAFANSKAREEIDLFILGEGEERPALEAMIHSLGLENRVFLKGNVENPYAYFSKAEFFLSSSRHEGFPNTLIEALTCECPCISFACETGPDEIIQTDTNGILIEPENIEKLTEAIDMLYFDDLLRETFKRNSRASVSHLSTPMIAQEWLKL